MIIYVLLFLNFVFTCFCFTEIISREHKKLCAALLIALNISFSLKMEIQKLDTNLEIFKKSILADLGDIKFKIGGVNE